MSKLNGLPVLSRRNSAASRRPSASRISATALLLAFVSACLASFSVLGKEELPSAKGVMRKPINKLPFSEWTATQGDYSVEFRFARFEEYKATGSLESMLSSGKYNENYHSMLTWLGTVFLSNAQISTSSLWNVDPCCRGDGSFISIPYSMMFPKGEIVLVELRNSGTVNLVVPNPISESPIGDFECATSSFSGSDLRERRCFVLAPGYSAYAMTAVAGGEQELQARLTSFEKSSRVRPLSSAKNCRTFVRKNLEDIEFCYNTNDELKQTSVSIKNNRLDPILLRYEIRPDNFTCHVPNWSVNGEEIVLPGEHALLNRGPLDLYGAISACLSMDKTMILAHAADPKLVADVQQKRKAISEARAAAAAAARAEAAAPPKPLAGYPALACSGMATFTWYRQRTDSFEVESKAEVLNVQPHTKMDITDGTIAWKEGNRSCNINRYVGLMKCNEYFGSGSRYEFEGQCEIAQKKF